MLQLVSSTEHGVVRSAPDGASGQSLCYDNVVGSHYDLTHAQHLSLIGPYLFLLCILLYARCV